MTAIINTIAWILCIVVGGLLLSDFIRTEIHFLQEKHTKTSGEGAPGDGSAKV